MGPQITITKLVIQESGCYNNLLSRPYEAVANNATLSLISQQMEQHSRIDPTQHASASLFSGMGNGIVLPRATPGGVIAIPDGWSSQRFRFVMNVEIQDRGVVYYYIFQGYSEYKGVSFNNTLDDEMKFFINGYVRISRSVDYSSITGGFVDVVTESAQVVNGRYIHNTTQQDVYGLRPMDLFIGVQSNYITQDYDFAHRDAKIDDVRLKKNRDSFTSRRANSLPSSFVSNAVNSYRDASMIAEAGSESGDLYGRCSINANEKLPDYNIFIQTLSNLHGITGTTTFTLNDLAHIDPQIAQKTDYCRLGDAVHVNYTESSSPWGGTTVQAQLATMLGNAIPALMSEHFIGEVKFSSHNLTFGAVVDTDVERLLNFNMGSMPSLAPAFVRRLEAEIIPDLTFGGKEVYTLEFHGNLYGDSFITLGVGSYPPLEFVVPSFCDSLIVPVVSTDERSFTDLAGSLEHIVNHTRLGTMYAPEPTATNNYSDF